MISRLGLLLALASIVGMAACGGNGGSGSSTVTSVSVTCSPSSVTSGGTSQCSATVNGTGNFSTAVNWHASAGSISSAGLLMAPTVTTSLVDTVTATSAQNSGVAGTATVTVNVTSANVAPIIVDAGPQPQTFTSTNVAFVTVTVCVPGTSNCQNIDHIMVDTGSFGLRLMSSASGGELNLSLPTENDSSGNPLDECLVFLDGFIWGPIQTANVSIAGESANNVPVQLIIPSSSSPAVPSSCSSQNPSGGTGNEGNSLQAFGANGIIGVGVFPLDCGAACTSQNSSPPDQYYDCPSSGTCTPTFVTLTQQVPNPVTLFTSTGDDNGVLIQLPSVPDGGSADVNGSLIFGIGTQSNNGLGSVQVYGLNNNADFTTTFNGSTYPGFVDSGSNGFFFQDSSISTCPSPNQEWYCPSNSPDSLSAGNQGTNMSSPVTVNFSIENADSLFSGSNTAFSTLGGTYPGTPAGFDWGLSFFYGRNPGVFTAIDGAPTPVGSGPYFAF
jgi:hypothetical protein